MRTGSTTGKPADFVENSFQRKVSRSIWELSIRIVVWRPKDQSMSVTSAQNLSAPADPSCFTKEVMKGKLIPRPNQIYSGVISVVNSLPVRSIWSFTWNKDTPKLNAVIVESNYKICQNMGEAALKSHIRPNVQTAIYPFTLPIMSKSLKYVISLERTITVPMNISATHTPRGNLNAAYADRCSWGNTPFNSTWRVLTLIKTSRVLTAKRKFFTCQNTWAPSMGWDPWRPGRWPQA